MKDNKIYNAIAMVPGNVTAKCYLYLGLQNQVYDSYSGSINDVIESVRNNLELDLRKAKAQVSSKTLYEVLNSYKNIIDDQELIDYVTVDISNGAHIYSAISNYFGLLMLSINKEDHGILEGLLDVFNRFSKVFEIQTNKNTLTSSKNIIIAQEFNPSDFLYFPLDKIKGIVTIHGSRTSHTVEICEQLNIPLFIQANMNLNENYKSTYLTLKDNTITKMFA